MKSVAMTTHMCLEFYSIAIPVADV